ncbi:MAG TPA: aminotransferase class I/II-fold pyridoxal phosphate-dependent enzyme, partial [Thermoleophilaceae bacterium]
MAGQPETTIFTTMTALAESTGAINLGQGFPDEDGPTVVIDAAVDALRSGHNQYAPLPGIPALRQAIARHQQRRYGIELDPDTQVQVTFGATEALASALLALVQPGDEVAMLDPSYDSYAAVVALAGGVPRPIPLAPPDWRVEPDAVAAAVSDRTRVLLVNSPHNPTGRVLDAGELDTLADACRRHDVIALTDEVYEHLIYDGNHIPIATRDAMWERTITVSSIGKTHSFTGWKIGWASGPAELVAAVRGVKQFLTFAGGTPLQHAAAVALDEAGEDAEKLAASLAQKRDLLADGLNAAGFDVLDTSGTYFLTADPRPLGFDDAVALCERLPVEAGVVAIPLSAFTAEPADRVRPLVRFAFCKKR